MKIAGRSDIGLIRVSNQDNYLITKNKKGDTLAIVCDGIGGAKAGDVASLMTTKNIGESFVEIDGFDDVMAGEEWLRKVLKQTNDKIFSATVMSKDYEGMGTTFVGAIIVDNEIVIANVGDSRAYVLDNEQLKQITVDHSLVNQLVASGEIKIEEVETHPQRNILTNALGVIGNLRIDTFKVDKGDKILLCTDGLSGYVKHDLIEKTLSKNDYSLDQMLETLISSANKVGGYDNITAIIVDIGGVVNATK